MGFLHKGLIIIVTCFDAMVSFISSKKWNGSLLKVQISFRYFLLIGFVIMIIKWILDLTNDESTIYIMYYFIIVVLLYTRIGCFKE